jgi:NADPH2:quinone reductase
MIARAARLIEHGAPLQVEPIELSSPSDDEVVVDLAYGGLNPVDGYAAQGKVAPNGPLPRTLGGEASGHLDGTPVLVNGEGLGSLRDGVFASAAVVPRAAIFELPPNLPLDEAACLGVVGSTAWRAVEIGEVGPGDRVLVLGGAGGVGQSVISYAASKGAEVWGQTGSGEKAEAIRDFGAKEAVVADAAGLADSIRDFAPTVVIDPLAGEFTAAAFSAMAQHGRLVLLGASAGAEAKLNLQQLYRNQLRLLTYGGLIATREERRFAITHVIAAVAEGRMRVRVARRVPLADVNEAFRSLTDRTLIGKIVLDLQ